MVEPSELEAIVSRGPTEESRHVVYGAIAKTQDLVQHRDKGRDFDQLEYYAHPGQFEPVFHDTIAPYTTALVNGMYWDQRYPRLLSSSNLKDLAEREGGPYLRAIADVTCDIGGSVEATVKATPPESPYYEWNASEGKEAPALNAAGRSGILMSTVDILPSSLPKEVSQ